MNRYEVSILAANDGFALSVNPEGYTGSARYQSFRDWSELRHYFASFDLSEDLLGQFDRMHCCLKPGYVYKEHFFLPDAVGQLVAAADSCDCGPAVLLQSAA